MRFGTGYPERRHAAPPDPLRGRGMLRMRSTDPDHVESGHGPSEASKGEVTGRRHLELGWDQGGQSMRDQDLPRPRLGTEARRQTGDRTDRAVVPSPSKPMAPMVAEPVAMPMATPRSYPSRRHRSCKSPAPTA